MNAREYYLNLQSAIYAVPQMLRSDIQFEEIDANECYVRGVILLVGDLELRIAEYVITEPVVTRPKYRYQLQTSAGQLVSRWDNAPHHPTITTFPHHRHDDQNIAHPTLPMDIPGVLDAALPFIFPSTTD